MGLRTWLAAPVLKAMAQQQQNERELVASLYDVYQRLRMLEVRRGQRNGGHDARLEVTTDPRRDEALNQALLERKGYRP